MLLEIIEEDPEPHRVLRSANDEVQQDFAQPFFDALLSLGGVVKKCFGSELVNGWEKAITEFEEKYTQAGCRGGWVRDNIIEPCT